MPSNAVKMCATIAKQKKAMRELPREEPLRFGEINLLLDVRSSFEISNHVGNFELKMIQGGMIDNKILAFNLLN